MGTDIHSIAQVCRDGQWETVAVGVSGDPRGYNAFAMLADVRNGRGFAGIKTSDGFPVMHDPRGLPDDLQADDQVKIDRNKLVAAWDWDGNTVDVASKEARRLQYMEDDLMWLGDHSHSWCTLAELRRFCEDVASKYTATLCGVVDVDEYRAAKAANRPFASWFGDVGGWSVLVVNESDLASVPTATHVRCEWLVNALEQSYLNDIVKALELVRDRCNATDDDVRYVFGFDS